MPKISPAAIPVSIARARPGRRRPACTHTNAMNAMTAAAGQCENEPNDSPIGFADRDTDSSATPEQSTRAPVISQNRSDALAIGTATISANTRLVVSSGSTNASGRLPIDQAASACPATIEPMPSSHRGLWNRSTISRSDRKRESGSRCAAFCCSTKPVPMRSAASRVSP